jgi:hypothetical protein
VRAREQVEQHEEAGLAASRQTDVGGPIFQPYSPGAVGRATR